MGRWPPRGTPDDQEKRGVLVARLATECVRSSQWMRAGEYVEQEADAFAQDITIKVLAALANPAKEPVGYSLRECVWYATRDHLKVHARKMVRRARVESSWSEPLSASDRGGGGGEALTRDDIYPDPECALPSERLEAEQRAREMESIIRGALARLSASDRELIEWCWLRPDGPPSRSEKLDYATSKGWEKNNLSQRVFQAKRRLTTELKNDPRFREILGGMLRRDPEA